MRANVQIQLFFILISKIKTPVEVIRTKAWIQTNMRFFEKSQLKGRPPSLLDEDQINYEDSDPEDNSDKLMMTEYDEDNVIVIDLRCEISGFCLLLSFCQNERT